MTAVKRPRLSRLVNGSRTRKSAGRISNLIRAPNPRKVVPVTIEVWRESKLAIGASIVLKYRQRAGHPGSIWNNFRNS